MFKFVSKNLEANTTEWKTNPDTKTVVELCGDPWKCARYRRCKSRRLFTGNNRR